MPTLLDGLTDQLVVGNATMRRRVGGAAGKRRNLVNLSPAPSLPHACGHSLRNALLDQNRKWQCRTLMMEGLLNTIDGRGNYSQITNTTLAPQRIKLKVS